LTRWKNTGYSCFKTDSGGLARLFFAVEPMRTVGSFRIELERQFKFSKWRNG